MTTLTKSLIGAALTLPLVAFVAGVLAAPEPVPDDRSRPVIIGRVSQDDTEAPQDRRLPDDDGDRDQAGQGRDDTDDDKDDGSNDGSDDGSGEGPAAPITPAPRYPDDDDDSGDDDGGDEYGGDIDDTGDTGDSGAGDD